MPETPTPQAEESANDKLFKSHHDPRRCRFKPFARNKLGSQRPAIYWYDNIAPIVYRDYLVRVWKRQGSLLYFVFLNNKTGKDLHLQTPKCHVDLGNPLHALARDPSSASFVTEGEYPDPDMAESCGFLFLTDDFIDNLDPLYPPPDHGHPGQDSIPIDLPSSAEGDGKTPRSGSRMKDRIVANVIAALDSKLLDEHDRKLLERMLKP